MLDIIPDLRVVIPLMVFYALLVFVVWKILLPPVLAVLEERTKRIEGAQRSARDYQAKAEQKKALYDQKMADAKRQAALELGSRLRRAREEEQKILAAARETAAATVEKAREEIRAEVSAARSEIESSAMALSRSLAGRLLERKVS